MIELLNSRKARPSVARQQSTGKHLSHHLRPTSTRGQNLETRHGSGLRLLHITRKHIPSRRLRTKRLSITWASIGSTKSSVAPMDLSKFLSLESSKTPFAKLGLMLLLAWARQLLVVRNYNSPIDGHLSS